jgi:penicillin-binding protein 1C
VYYGYLNYGLTSASRYYFAKEPKNLTKAEQIALLILPKDPKKYNPYKESKAFKERFSLVIKTLKKEHILSDTEAENIQSEELQFNYEYDDVLPYVTDFMEHSYSKWRLKNDSETKKEAPIITTTIDSSLTEKIDTLARNTILDLSWKDVSDYGIIILDRKTNELRTMIGGVNYRASEGQVNSTLALRQPGSTIKPFTYTLAFEKFGLKPGDMILDLPTAYKTSE